jgi:segregation and condensation protein B
LKQSTSSTPDTGSAADYSTGVQSNRASEKASSLGLAARIEGLLFVAAEPIAVSQLARFLDATAAEVRLALGEMAEALMSRGIRLQESRYGIQLTTAPELASQVERFLNLENIASLTKAALEVLSIVAYQQPVTRPQIDAIRGVNSDSVLRTLLRHALIEEVGRIEGPGRPILYATTPEFLQHFGLSSLSELPPLEQSGEKLTAAKGEMEKRETGEEQDG